MKERKNVITMKGNPLTLLGEELKVGSPAPDFELLDAGLATVKSSSFRGRVCVITSIPSLDTSVCDIMTRRFNEAASAMGENVVVLAVSMDLPFAQKRWCGAAGAKNIQVLSDHREASFGQAFGVLIKELRLLARAVFVIDGGGIVRYIEIVSEVADEPDYERALNAVRELLG